MSNLAPVVIESNDYMRADLGALAKVLQPHEAPANFQNVAVNNSTVHFGTKTYIDHVTIKQFVNGSENATSENTEANVKNKEPDDKNIVVTQPWTWKGVRKLQEKWGITAKHCAFCTIVFAILFVTTIGLSLGLSSKPSNGNQGQIFHNNESLVVNEPIQTDIDSVLLPQSSLRLISRREWLAQPPAGPLDPLDLPVPFVIITHTATENCTDQASCVFYVRYMQTFHIESRKWYDIAYNFLVGGDGAVYEGRGWDKVASHTKGYNSRSIGIAVIGTFNDYLPPKRQLVATHQIIEMGLALGKISKDYKLFGHRQLIPTLSPGNALFAEIQKWPHFARDFDNTTQVIE